MPAEAVNMPTSPTWYGGAPRPAANKRPPGQGGGAFVATLKPKQKPWQTNANSFLDSMMLPGSAEWSPNAMKEPPPVRAITFGPPSGEDGGGGGGSRGRGGHGGGGSSVGFAPAAFGNGERYGPDGARPDGRHRIEGGVSRDSKQLDDYYALQNGPLGDKAGRDARVDALNDRGITSGFGGGAMKDGQPVQFDEWGAKDPGFADGVEELPVSALDGGWFDVGERGPEKMKIEDGKLTVVPNHELNPAAGRAGGAVTPDGSGPPSPVKTGTVAAFGGPSDQMQFSDTQTTAAPVARSAPSFGEVAAGFGSGGAFDAAALPNVDGRPNGVDKRTWKRFSRTPSFAAMSWEFENADRRYDKRGKAEKTDKAQHEADAVEGTKAALKLAYPAAFSPEIEGALTRMKPSVAAGFLNGIAGHLAQQDRERPAAAPQAVPEGYEAKPSEFTTSGAPKRYELVKKDPTKDPKPWAYDVPGMPGTKVFGVNNSPLGSRDMTPKAAPNVAELRKQYPKARITLHSDGGVSIDDPGTKDEKPTGTPMMRLDERGQPAGVMTIPPGYEFDPKTKQLVRTAVVPATNQPLRTGSKFFGGKK